MQLHHLYLKHWANDISVVFIKLLVSKYVQIEYVKEKRLSLVGFFLIFMVIHGTFMQVKEIFTVESCNN